MDLIEEWHQSEEWQIKKRRAQQFLTEYTEVGQGWHVSYRTVKRHYFSYCRMLKLSVFDYSWSELFHVLTDHYVLDSSPMTLMGRRMKHPLGLPADPTVKARHPISTQTKHAVYEKLQKNQMICALCHQPIGEDDALHIDHILPVSIGGNDDLSNLQMVHARCNLSKGSLRQQRIVTEYIPLPDE